MTQSGRFLPFSLNENPFVKVNGGVFSLVDSYLKEANNTILNNKDVFVDAWLNLLGKKVKQKVF